MGMDAYDRSKAARGVWAADAHTQKRYGFSLLDIVRTNPKTIDVGGTVIRHPEGVLNVTQFTQVALTVLSCAGVAELREAGACSDDNWFCGHSVGEYSALSAVTDVLSLDPRGCDLPPRTDDATLCAAMKMVGQIMPWASFGQSGSHRWCDSQRNC